MNYQIHWTNWPQPKGGKRNTEFWKSELNSLCTSIEKILWCKINLVEKFFHFFIRYPFPLFKNMSLPFIIDFFRKNKWNHRLTCIQVLKPKVETTALDSITALPRSVSIQNNKCLHFPHISKVNFNLSYGVDSLYMWLLRTIKEIYRFFSKVCQRFFYSPFIHLCWHPTKETVTFTIILGLMVFAFMVKIQQILYYQLIVDTLKPQ